MDEVKRNDLIFFRNEILQDIKNVEKKIYENISKLAEQLQTSNIINEQKNEYFKEKFEEVLIKVDTSAFQNKINDKMEKYKKKLDNKIINNNVKIIKMEKDLSNACYKYDKIFLTNMSSPGLIGDGCPYPTMKSFFIYLDKKMKELILTKDKAFSDFKELKFYIDKTFENFEKNMDKNEEEIENNITERFKDHDKLVKERLKVVEDRFDSIRLENSKQIFNIIKNQEIINEKLKLELKKYSLINETLVNYYQNQNKIEKNNEKENKYKNLINSKSKRKSVIKTLNLNDIIPELKKIEESYNLNSNLFKINDRKEFKVQDSHSFEIKNQQKDSFDKNRKKSNKSLFMRKRTLGNSLLKPKININILNNDNIINYDNSNNSSKNITKISDDKLIEEKKQINLDNSVKRTNTVSFGRAASEKKVFFDKIIKENNILDSTKREENILKSSLKKEYKSKLILSPLEDNNKNNRVKNEDIKIINLKTEIKNINPKKEHNESNYRKNNMYKEINFSTEKENRKKNNEENFQKNKIEEKKITLFKNTINTEHILKDLNIIVDSKMTQKIDKINEHIIKYHKQSNEKFEIIFKQINYLFHEIGKFLKEKKSSMNNIFLKPSNSHIENKNNNNFNNLKNIFITGDSIIPLKSFEKTYRNTNRSGDNSNSVKSSEIKNLRKTNNNIFNDLKNNENYKVDNNYCILINKIEPYLIKKFKNPKI